MASTLSKAFPAAVKEIRMHFSPTSASSSGARKFVAQHYKEVKASNPYIPFLVREAQGGPARLFVRLERGAEKNAEISNLEPSAIIKALEDLIK
ncbi:NADH dehydrogenase (ubiquinone) 1 alpha subcomplex subunit 2 [Malassezia restricta]|uniref:NADH dehydrogenase [ubiquinone] 1 alpha subcomplex subunit 2 n=1 Tax=Malassezia restricta (strain ATCC 96810 / NBRC 103918 / CBS 7877) TaxID=425264 RepID=A0A3G2S2R5_MALR7|nr:NADH dehydrogenase (ubiquinone) 1 alpha subcomplex subunit 2 [Malassezia restricta]AXA49578.1 NADH dehydrogenase (ubiquinone) 1 alpha subcomplex subunit 2 [Malassezia restricta]AYO42250.1 NADH dehydrogenase [ubiquinone] 1 alpha subcomplex subunit 2 [Malassezia restricta CBS 7877]